MYCFSFCPLGQHSQFSPQTFLRLFYVLFYFHHWAGGGKACQTYLQNVFPEPVRVAADHFFECSPVDGLHLHTAMPQTFVNACLLHGPKRF